MLEFFLSYKMVKVHIEYSGHLNMLIIILIADHSSIHSRAWFTLGIKTFEVKPAVV
jgi:hypothetical protein